MTAENPDFETSIAEPGYFDELVLLMDIAAGRSAVGTPIDPLLENEVREWGNSTESQDTIEFFRKITGLEL